MRYLQYTTFTSANNKNNNNNSGSRDNYYSGSLYLSLKPKFETLV